MRKERWTPEQKAAIVLEGIKGDSCLFVVNLSLFPLFPHFSLLTLQMSKVLRLI